MKLPAAKIARWTPKAKAAVVAAINAGDLTEAAALRRYHLTREELGGWLRNESLGGVPALRVTKVQHYARAFA